MAARPNAYVTRKDVYDNITVDMRVFAPMTAHVDLVMQEAALAYIDLIQEIKKRWKGNQ